MHKYFAVVETAHGEGADLFVMDTMEDMLSASENAVMEFRFMHPEYYNYSLCVKISEGVTDEGRN